MKKAQKAKTGSKNGVKSSLPPRDSNTYDQTEADSPPMGGYKAASVSATSRLAHPARSRGGAHASPPTAGVGEPASVRCSLCPLPPKWIKVVKFFHAFNPPTATAQGRQFPKRGGSYLPPKTERAKALLRAVAEKYAPPTPIDGPVMLTLLWTFPGDVVEWKITRPDLDNLNKLVQDGMTAAGYWHKDEQVADLHLSKFNGPMPGLAVLVGRLDRIETAGQQDGGLRR